MMISRKIKHIIFSEENNLKNISATYDSDDFFEKRNKSLDQKQDNREINFSSSLDNLFDSYDD